MLIEESGTANLAAWRSMLRRSGLPPLTKLVCLNLSLYMEHRSCWPSLRQQARDTGLNSGSLARQLRIARAEGYLTWATGAGARRTGAITGYNATFPGSYGALATGFLDVPPLPMAPPNIGATNCFAA
jgi:hypothetical protein